MNTPAKHAHGSLKAAIFRIRETGEPMEVTGFVRAQNHRVLARTFGFLFSIRQTSPWGNRVPKHERSYRVSFIGTP